MWWLFMDPEDAGKIGGTVLIILLIIGGILSVIHKCNPESFKQKNNIIRPDSTIVEDNKTIKYDTILNNDSILIIRKK